MPEDCIKIEVKGIYATALVSLLLDNGFLIVNPSIEVENRFNVKPIEEEAELLIYTRRDLQGVEVYGSQDVVSCFCDLIAENLKESIMRYKTRCNLDIEFPLSMKIELDQLRRKVTSTIEYHHYYKAFGGHVIGLVDMAERLIRSGKPSFQVESDFKKIFLKYSPIEGSNIGVSHVKLNGNLIELGKASLEVLEDDYLEYTRVMSSGGEYDGLQVRKEAGDKAVTRIELGEYNLITRYYSIDGSIKGTYININTPVKVYTNFIRYIDLDVDVVIWPDGHAEIIDLEKLRNSENQGVITEYLAGKAKKEAKRLLKRYQ